MRALLIKLAGVRTTWTDTGERTATPDRAKRELRAKNPGCLVIDVAEADVARMTGAARG